LEQVLRLDKSLQALKHTRVYKYLSEDI
jgi:hypothetical protein